MLKNTCGPTKDDNYQETGENYIIRSFMIVSTKYYVIESIIIGWVGNVARVVENCILGCGGGRGEPEDMRSLKCEA